MTSTTDIHKVHEMVRVLAVVITDPSLDLSDNDIVNTAFGLYATLICSMLDVLMERAVDDSTSLEAAEHMRDQSMEQCAKYTALLLEKCPRRQVTLN